MNSKFRSHMYPKALLRKIFWYALKNIGTSEVINISLEDEKYNNTAISNIEDLKNFFKKDRNFYFYLEKSLWFEYEEKWNIIEKDFIEKVDDSIIKILNNNKFLKNKAIFKQLNTLFIQKKETILNFFILTIFRSNLSLPKYPVKSLSSNKVFLDHNNEKILEVIKDSDKNLFIENWNKIEKLINFNEYEVFFLELYIFSIPNPPIYFSIGKNNKYEYVVIHISKGILLLVLKNYRFFINLENENYKIEFNKYNYKYDSIFISNKENVNMKEVLNNFSYNLFHNNWLCFWIFKSKNIYYLGPNNQLEIFIEKSIKKIFEERRKYFSNVKNFDKSPIFVYKY